MKRIITLLILIAFASPLLAQKLSSKEKKIIKVVEANHEEAVKFLEKVVNINSGTLNMEGVKEVGDVFSAELDKIDMRTEWYDMPPVIKRAGHLFAYTDGSKGKKIILIGHLDTVFEPDSPFQTYIDQDTIAKGPGTNDMKGGNVVFLYALKALHEVGALDDSQIIVALIGDEERSGKPTSISRKHLVDAAKESDIALAFETSTGLNYATVARRGSSSWEMEVTARRAHSSGIFRESVGAGAIYETSRILHTFYNELREENLTFNPGIILGGTDVTFDPSTSQGTAYGKNNVISQSVTVTGDLRFITPDQLQNARAKMKEIVSQNLPHTEATITFSDEYYPSMPVTDGNMALLEVLSQVSVDLGQGEVKAYDPGRRGAGDISFVAEYVDCLDGLGTMGGGAHSEREYVDLTSFEDLTKRTALLIYRLINQN